ncbi:MAG: DUF4292 domain-containing protein [Bacteroidia bacterium]|nr:DUF4292 domain-containing protein [Bacteroidia bacterium]
MKSPRTTLVYLLLIASTLTACKTLRTAGDPVPAEREWRTLLAQAEAARYTYEVMTISGRATAAFPGAEGGQEISVSYRIKMVHDSAILIRITKFIEVARILATRDSLFVLDKINRTWGAFGYGITREYTGLDLDFGQLEALILGHFDPVPAQLTNLDPRGTNPRRFTGMAAGKTFTYSLDTRIMRLTRLEVAAPDQAAVITYGGHTAPALLPQEIGIRVSGADSLRLDLAHTRMETADPADRKIEFSIPRDYDRMEPE